MRFAHLGRVYRDMLQVTGDATGNPTMTMMFNPCREDRATLGSDPSVRQAPR